MSGRITEATVAAFIADPDDARHGTRTGYVYGCRCADCTTAEADYRRAHSRGERAADPTGHEPLAFEREAWTARGACRGMETTVFFPGLSEATRPAKEICAGCPVTAECLDYALRTGQKFGIWGGTSERERRRMRRDQGIRFSTAPHNNTRRAS